MHKISQLFAESGCLLALNNCPNGIRADARNIIGLSPFKVEGKLCPVGSIRLDVVAANESLSIAIFISPRLPFGNTSIVIESEKTRTVDKVNYGV